MSNDEKRDSKPSDDAGETMGRRETLRLATLAAALGAGLSVTFHLEDAQAEGAVVQLKLYRNQQKGDELVHTANLSPELSKAILGGAAGSYQWKAYAQNSLIGAGPMQFKVQQQKKDSGKAAPPPTTGWDVKKNTPS